MKTAILLGVLIIACTAIEAPSFNYSYKVNFDEYYKTDNGTFQINGQTFYDPINNQERVDRSNGRYNQFCNTILPDVSTPCQSITKGDRRWMVFPSKSLCCFCCDSDHGCGILKPDWLKGADYLGTEQIIDTVYDKWNQQSELGYNYLWVTKDEAQTPRRLEQESDNYLVTDYNLHSFRNQTFPDSTFALPTYCNQDCGKESTCGQIRAKRRNSKVSVK